MKSCQVTGAWNVMSEDKISVRAGRHGAWHVTSQGGRGQ